jgi:hypothetical protein
VAVVAGLAAIVLIGIWLRGQLVHDVTIVRVAPVDEPPRFTGSAEDLMAEFEADKTAADAKYNGCVVVVEGTVWARADGGPIAHVLVLDKQLQCGFDESDPAPTAKLMSEVKIRGVCNRTEGDSILVWHCALVK